jgi:trimeric autotransporter adhesin
LAALKTFLQRRSKFSKGTGKDERKLTMNPLSHPKTVVGPMLITVVVVCLSGQPAQAYLPPPVPDGAYPNRNTAEGGSALFYLTTGSDNTAVGAAALLENFTGSRNTAIGSQALGNNNGFDNTALGFNALHGNLDGLDNTGIGSNALHGNRDGGANTAIGFSALANNNGSGNTAVGYEALGVNLAGNQNTAIGFSALYLNKGSNNTANGFRALLNNSTGTNNTANGVDALFVNNGNQNTADGVAALHQNSTGGFNTANGYQALYFNQAGSNNTADGSNALLHNTGSNNIAVGSSAGINLTTGSNNIDIGAPGVGAESAKIHIGKQGTQNGTFIAGIYGVAGTGSQVVVNSAGKLGVTASSARFKNDIKPMDNSSQAVLALKPVTFHYKKEIDPDRSPQFGLVAEEVEKINPDLVVRDGDGKPYSVRYEAVNAMLLNEFLKEHRKVEKLASTIAQQQKDFHAISANQEKEIKALTASLKEQGAEIQKVSAELKLRKSAPQIAKNDVR